MEKPKLTKEQKKKNMRRWIKALRSGKYEQCRGSYCSATSKGKCYCAAGVANLVLVGGPFNVLGAKALLGEFPDNFKLMYKGNPTAVAILNDIHNLSFKQIAARLERAYL